MSMVAAFEFTEIGETALPVKHRSAFVAMLRGAEVSSQGNVHRAGETPVWRAPSGMMPMSPALGLQGVCKEFDIRGVTAVSYNMAWEANDTTGEPGYFGDYTCTYQLLGVRTRTQALWFLDGGVNITPVAIEQLPEQATLITKEPEVVA